MKQEILSRLHSFKNNLRNSLSANNAGSLSAARFALLTNSVLSESVEYKSALKIPIPPRLSGAEVLLVVKIWLKSIVTVVQRILVKLSTIATALCCFFSKVSCVCGSDFASCFPLF